MMHSEPRSAAITQQLVANMGATNERTSMGPPGFLKGEPAGARFTTIGSTGYLLCTTTADNGRAANGLNALKGNNHDRDT